MYQWMANGRQSTLATIEVVHSLLLRLHISESQSNTQSIGARPT